MNDEKLMFFVRNKRLLDKLPEPQKLEVEYEVISHADIVGALHFGPYFFTIWEIGWKKSLGEPRRLCLRITEACTRPDDEQWKKASKKGFYHGGGIAHEIIALASLFLRRRLTLGPIVRRDGVPLMLQSDFGGAPKYLALGQSNLASLEEWLKLVESLDSKHHQAFILSARLYQESLELLGTKADLAYLNLISAVEVLAEGYPIVKPSLVEVDAKLSELVSQIPDQTLQASIIQKIMERERFIARRFATFLTDHVERSFWEDTERPDLGRIDEKELFELMLRVYEQRSRTLHRGEPFPPGTGWTAEELPTGLAMSHGEKLWDRKDFIPAAPFFERLVNHVLKSFLKRNQAGIQL